ncbi:hypothetical protein BV20DRAFT_784667 [Pilatotrama ljubarskyi]|nr:hypothetical protein BV20DRAFT_784667 [Pilatotrama ljubarskyi]
MAGVWLRGTHRPRSVSRTRKCYVSVTPALLQSPDACEPRFRLTNRDRRSPFPTSHAVGSRRYPSHTLDPSFVRQPQRRRLQSTRPRSTTVQEEVVRGGAKRLDWALPSSISHRRNHPSPSRSNRRALTLASRVHLSLAVSSHPKPSNGSFFALSPSHRCCAVASYSIRGCPRLRTLAIPCSIRNLHGHHRLFSGCSPAAVPTLRRILGVFLPRRDMHRDICDVCSEAPGSA